MNVRVVLCPVDFSAPSEAAARYGARLARGLGAEVHLAHVLPLQMPIMPVPDIGLTPQEVVAPPSLELERDTRSTLTQLATELCVEPHVHVVTGTTAREIVKLADAIHADVIVVGTHGRTGLAHMLMGSVAERVVRTASRPVLVVPAGTGRAALGLD